MPHFKREISTFVSQKNNTIFLALKLLRNIIIKRFSLWRE